MRSPLLFLVTTLGGVAFVAGCRDGSFSTVQVSDQNGDNAALIDFDSDISIPEGSAASAHLELHARDGDTMTPGLESADPTTLLIQQTPGDSKRFVFLGVKSGSTKVHLLANGGEVRTVSAVVVPPPPFGPPDAGPPVGGSPDAGPPADSGGDATSPDAGD